MRLKQHKKASKYAWRITGKMAKLSKITSKYRKKKEITITA